MIKSLYFSLKEKWLQWVNKSVTTNQNGFNVYCNDILNQCLDDLDVVKQTDHGVSLRLKQTGEIYDFWISPENFPYSYGFMISKINDHETKGPYGVWSVSYVTRYRLRNALKYHNSTKD